MQNFKQTETRSRIAFITKIEDIPGGVTVAVADLTQKVVYAATPIGKDPATGLYHVIKSAVAHANATNSATAYQVKKGHNFKVGDFLSTGTAKKAYAITSIDTADPVYDTLNVGTTLGVAVTAGDVLVHASAEAATNTSVLKYEPEAVTGHDFDVVPDNNHLVDAWIRATVKKDVAPAANSDVKAKLTHILWK